MRKNVFFSLRFEDTVSVDVRQGPHQRRSQQQWQMMEMMASCPRQDQSIFHQACQRIRISMLMMPLKRKEIPAEIFPLLVLPKEKGDCSSVRVHFTASIFLLRAT